MHRTTLLLVASAAVLLGAAPAHADREGDGAVRIPRILKTVHTEFVLPGAGWGQFVGRLDAAPVVGAYATDVALPAGAGCKLEVAVDSLTQGVYPRVGKHIVRIDPTARVPVRYTRTGRHGGVRWWSGTQVGVPAAVAVQRVPKSLRARHRQWIVTLASTGYLAAAPDEVACRSAVRELAKLSAYRVVRTLKLADGPPVLEAPFVTP